MNCRRRTRAIGLLRWNALLLGSILSGFFGNGLELRCLLPGFVVSGLLRSFLLHSVCCGLLLCCLLPSFVVSGPLICFLLQSVCGCLLLHCFLLGFVVCCLLR